LDAQNNKAQEGTSFPMGELPQVMRWCLDAAHFYLLSELPLGGDKSRSAYLAEQLHGSSMTLVASSFT
jgi:hypothetical protein